MISTGMARRLFAALILIGWVGAAQAAEIRVVSVHGMRAVMDDLRPRFERTTGHRLAIVFATLGGAVKHVQASEAIDVAVVPRQGIDRFVKEDRIATAGDVAWVARSRLGVAVRKGALRPVSGIEIVGPLPDELQDTLVFGAAVMASSREAAAARQFVDFLRSQEAAMVIAAKGMDPA